MNIILRVTALKMLMIGRAKGQFEIWEESVRDDDEGTWADLLNRVQDYATRRRLEANLKGNNSMDVDEVGGYASWDPWGSNQQGSSDQWGSGEQWHGDGSVDNHALGRVKVEE